MTALNLIHCQPDPKKFVMWASRHGLLPPGGDLGYAFHAALSAVFGSLAPKPFYYRDERAGLLAYTAHSGDALREASGLCAAPDLADALGLDAGPHSPGLNIRSFPAQWQAGRVLGFDVRVRPVRRSKDAQCKHGRERDAFRIPIDEEADEHVLRREAAYVEWLGERLQSSGAASLVEARMMRFRLTPVIRRTQAGSGDGSGNGNGNGKPRQPRVINGPDAVLSGHLRVEDSDAFANLLRHGIGRHRAFGFGMLLLKPASVDN
jgi:CRISPR system Cascade subunit CasE